LDGGVAIALSVQDGGLARKGTQTFARASFEINCKSNDHTRDHRSAAAPVLPGSVTIASRFSQSEWISDQGDGTEFAI
jgi:hypothetical protein